MKLLEMSLLEINFLNVTLKNFFDNSEKLLSVNNPQYKALFLIEYYLMIENHKNIQIWLLDNYKPLVYRIL